MLKYFKVENFRSFLEPVQISLELNGHAPDDDLSFASATTGVRASKCLAIIGANASGKTALINALGFLRWFTAYSFEAKPDSLMPLAPHFSAQDKPSSFEVEFELDGQTWRYRLSVTKERVLHESLETKLPSKGSRFSYIFKREWDDGAECYQVKLNQKQFKFLQKEADKVRPNASLISTAAQYGVELAKKLVPINARFNFGSGLSNAEFDKIIGASELYKNNVDIYNRMVSLLNEWDLGLSGVMLNEEPAFVVSQDAGKTVQNVYLPYGTHHVDGKDHTLPFSFESNGTRSAFFLLSKLLPVLQNGSIAVIDELEANLHPHMLPAILDLFFSPETNPHNAQIIFTTHSLEILNHLHKSQIVIVEKNNRCESEAWCLDEMEVRADDNFYAKYMAGAYGGVPKL